MVFHALAFILFCLKAKIKASAWKTIRKTQYDSYEDY